MVCEYKFSLGIFRLQWLLDDDNIVSEKEKVSFQKVNAVSHFWSPEKNKKINIWIQAKYEPVLFKKNNIL